jgi:hypothetical protein
VYEAAPLTVSVTALPAHTVEEGVIAKVGVEHPTNAKLSICVQRVAAKELTLMYCPLFGATNEKILALHTPGVGIGPV